MDYEEGQPIPPGYHVDTRIRKGLVIGGAVTFGVVYLFSVLTGVLIDSANEVVGNESSGYEPMYIPLAGPFVTMGTASDDLSSGGVALLAILGVAQVGGVGMLVAGLAVPKTELVRNDVSSIQVRPMVGQGTTGLSLGGKF
jgi:hypothetical protein